MNSTLARLTRSALRPLWREEPLHRERRRCRTLVAAPFAAIAGIAWGVFAAPQLVEGSAPFWAAVGAFTLPFLLWLEQRLVGPVAVLARRAGLGDGHLAAAVWETAVVGGFVYLLTGGLGAPVVPATGTALGLGAAYAVGMEYLLCGGAAADVAGLIRGGERGGAPRHRDHSRAATLAIRGDHDDAVRALEAALAERPREAATYLHLSRVHVAAGRPDRALDTLRLGLRKAATTPEAEAFLVRQIHEICLTRLDDVSEALEDLRLLAQRAPPGPHLEWALGEIDEIEAGNRRS